MTRTYTLKRQHRPRVARRVVLAVAAAAVAGAMSIVGGVHTTPTPYSHHVAAIAAVHESRHTTCSLMEKARGAGVGDRGVGRSLLGRVHDGDVRPREPR